MIKEICEKLKFPDEATEYLYVTYQRIQSSVELWHNMQACVDEYFSNQAEYFDDLHRIADKSGIRSETIDMVFLLISAVRLRAVYQEKGLPETLFWESMQDLRYKLSECKKLHGVWGTFVLRWFEGFFRCERFQLGRLQYEPSTFPAEAYKGLKRGDKVYTCHIPSSGKMEISAVMDSLNRAYVFYQDSLNEGILPVICNSWLLYEPFDKVFEESKNIQDFRGIFNILENRLDEIYSNFWRIFYTPYSAENLPNAPEDTRLQKRMKAYLLEGNPMGVGVGVLLFDGEKII